MGIFMQLVCLLRQLILVLFLQLLQLQGIQILSKLLLVINCASFTPSFTPFLLLLLQKPEGSCCEMGMARVELIAGYRAYSKLLQTQEEETLLIF